jgi:hypothetical protein
MQRTVASGLSLVFALALAAPAAAQQASEALEADTDGDGFVTAEEAQAHSEQRFDDITGDEEEMTLEQFSSAILGAETTTAEHETAWDPQTEFEAADADDSGSISREEWMSWREDRFRQAAGDADQIKVGLYRSVDSSGALAGTDAGGESDVGVTVTPDAGATPADDQGDGDEEEAGSN